MTEGRYVTLKLNKKVISELDELLKKTTEFKSRSDFIYEAIREHMNYIRIRNSVNYPASIDARLASDDLQRKS